MGVPPRLWPLVLALPLIACIDGPSHASPTLSLPSAHRAELDATAVSEPEATEAPSITSTPAVPDVGADLTVSPALAGHYATDVRYHHESACSRSWDSYTSHTSLVLDVSDDGTATACRGKHMDDVGPESHLEMMEQQGFRGTWRRDGAWMDLDLALDDAACPQRRGYTNREPSPWHLRCVALSPTSGSASAVTLPVLGCQFVTPVYTEALGYEVEGVLPDPWILLGEGHGVRVVLDKGALMANLEDRFVLTRAPAPITNDAWTAPFEAPEPAAPGPRGAQRPRF
jgi:hypothetical protein